MKLFNVKNIILAMSMMMFLAFANIAMAFEIEISDSIPVEGDFVLSPSKAELFLSPGEDEIKQLKITNRTGEKLDIKIGVEDFAGDEKYSTKLLGEERGRYSLRDYVKIDRNNFVLNHGEKAIIQVFISIPEDAEPGGLYGAVTVSAKKDSKATEEEKQIFVVSRLATLFFVRVNGDAYTDGKLKTFTSSKKIYTDSEVELKVVYENNGSVHLNPYADIEIKNIFGNKVDAMDISPWFVMPGFSRSRTIGWNKKTSLGRYTAKIYLNRGYGSGVDEATITFWVLPVKVIVGVGSSIVVILIFMLWFRSRFELKRKKDEF